jgi:hypothetical protein
LEVVDQLIDHLKSQESEEFSSSKPLQSTSRPGDAGGIRREISLRRPAYSAPGEVPALGFMFRN